LFSVAIQEPVTESTPCNGSNRKILATTNKKNPATVASRGVFVQVRKA